MPGYSGKPLSAKLGLKPDHVWYVIDAPDGYGEWLDPLPSGATIRYSRVPSGAAAVHLFATERAKLTKRLASLRKQVASDGFVWVSWPKKSSRVATDITEDVIREVALPMDWVDIKVCAVSDVWSGLKLVIRREAR